MGLDTSHNAWHGAYSAFMRWRIEIARCGGRRTDQLSLKDYPAVKHDPRGHFDSSVSCPKCGSKMRYYEGEDEGSGDVLFNYLQLECKSCDHVVHDWNDNFVWPDDAA